MNREDQIIKAAIEIFVNNLNPFEIYLFGSRAEGISAKHSDFDFALNCEKPAPVIRRKIEDKINEIAGLYKVDIVYLPEVEKDFRAMVVKTGRLIYGRKS